VQALYPHGGRGLRDAHCCRLYSSGIGGRCWSCSDGGGSGLALLRSNGGGATSPAAPQRQWCGRRGGRTVGRGKSCLLSWHCLWRRPIPPHKAPQRCGSRSTSNAATGPSGCASALAHAGSPLAVTIAATVTGRLRWSAAGNALLRGNDGQALAITVNAASAASARGRRALARRTPCNRGRLGATQGLNRRLQGRGGRETAEPEA